MLKQLLQNCASPGVNRWGKLVLRLMNRGHRRVQFWMYDFLELPRGNADILDVGCGGGGNIANLLKLAPNAVCHGIDPSELCVRTSAKLNRRAVAAGRAFFRLGSADALPYADNTFDLVTASETIYFWRDLADNFREVLRVLKAGGTFAICNEVATREQAKLWLELVEGTNMYSRDELRQYLAGAGFEHISLHLHQNRRWLCLTARKPA